MTGFKFEAKKLLISIVVLYFTRKPLDHLLQFWQQTLSSLWHGSSSSSLYVTQSEIFPDFPCFEQKSAKAHLITIASKDWFHLCLREQCFSSCRLSCSHRNLRSNGRFLPQKYMVCACALIIAWCSVSFLAGIWSSIWTYVVPHLKTIEWFKTLGGLSKCS